MLSPLPGFTRGWDAYDDLCRGPKWPWDHGPTWL